MQGVVFAVKGYTAMDQIVFLNPVGTLAIIALFTPEVTFAGMYTNNGSHMLQKGDVVDIVDIGTRVASTTMFSHSILHNPTPRVEPPDAETLPQQDEYTQNTTLRLPLNNNMRLRKRMAL
jgi:hypothetical protein